MKKRINVFLNLSLLVGGLIFSLSLSELLLRVFPKLASRYSFNQFVIQDTKNTMVESFNIERNYCIYRPSDILGYERIPNSTAGINSFGMVSKEYKLKKNENTYRILVLGDSITENNWYVEGLERRLNRSNPKLRYNFELWNAGIGAYQVDQYAAYLKYKGLRYAPDMIIIGFCLDDFNPSHRVYYKDENGFTMCYNPAPKLSKRIHLNNFLFKSSYLYRFLILKIDNLLSNSQTRCPDSKTEGFYYLRMIKDICQKNKILLLGVVFPYLKPLSEYADCEMKSYKEIVEVLQILDIDYIDLHKYFPEENRYALRIKRSDYVHPSPEGHEIAAELIYEYLIKNYFTILNSECPMEIKDYKNITLAK